MKKIWQLDLQYVRISMKNIKVLIILIIGIPSWIQSKLILKKPLAYRYKKLRKWCKFVIRLFRYQVIVRGSENIPNDEAVLFVSNHQDGFDPAIIISASPVPISFVSKKQNEKLPLFGSWAKTIENIHFNRDSREENIYMLREVTRRLKKGDNILIFPEGTRSKSSKVNEFKQGSTIPAQLSKVKIVPIAIDNSYSFSNSKSKNKVMYVSFLKPIDYELHSKNKQISEEIQALIEKEITTF